MSEQEAKDLLQSVDKELLLNLLEALIQEQEIPNKNIQKIQEV